MLNITKQILNKQTLTSKGFLKNKNCASIFKMEWHYYGTIRQKKSVPTKYNKLQNLCNTKNKQDMFLNETEQNTITLHSTSNEYDGRMININNY